MTFTTNFAAVACTLPARSVAAQTHGVGAARLGLERPARASSPVFDGRRRRRRRPCAGRRARDDVDHRPRAQVVAHAIARVHRPAELDRERRASASGARRRRVDVPAERDGDRADRVRRRQRAAVRRRRRPRRRPRSCRPTARCARRPPGCRARRGARPRRSARRWSRSRGRRASCETQAGRVVDAVAVGREPDGRQCAVTERVVDRHARRSPWSGCRRRRWRAARPVGAVGAHRERAARADLAVPDQAPAAGRLRRPPATVRTTAPRRRARSDRRRRLAQAEAQAALSAIRSPFGLITAGAR